MVYPDSGQTEWIELYNDNDSEVTLTDWFVDDIENAGSSPKKFTMTIAPKAFGVLDISASMFNNDSDTVRLMDSEETKKDSVSYTSSEKNYSLGKTVISSSTICIQTASKSTVNNICTNIIPTALIGANSPTKKSPDPTLKKTPSPTPGSKKLLPTLQSKKINTFQSQATNINHSTTENILGASTEILLNESSPQQIIHTLTILAFSYSILSIISIITKISFRKGIPAP